MSRRTSIRDAEILGQVEGKQSKDLVCGLPINCADKELGFSSVLWGH